MTLPDRLEQLIEFDVETSRVSSREGKTREFKDVFDRANLAYYGKTLAAFSNTDGGTIIFGVSDKPRLVKGFDEAELCDEADIVSHLRDSYHPEIPFSTKTYDYNGNIVFAIEVVKSANPPVICRKGRSKTVRKNDGSSKDKPITTEGTIYFRYSAQSRSIDYSELQSLLDERERKKMKAILENLKIIDRVGYERVGIVDTSALAKQDGVTNLYISKEATKGMNFIDKGKFVESEEEGAPAYVVAGQVRLNEVIHAPLEDEDKNLPSEVSRILTPLIHEIYGQDMGISPQQITKLIVFYDLEHMPFHEYDKKIKRRYITRRGIEALQEKIRNNPLEAIRAFGSKEKIAAFEQKA
ncbi:ATP-binding protein [Cohaesibacter sp. CAU 1516]|uniref:AlbA family DNA-binding domain-containing protein n=1 Tax=Cohaesibacter sp. CAU 1516 TaxID=2576038 RepID=UPI0010FDD4B9|nr:ATP-binding protein [Cohaesibacter sp. CAU 1516]TLP45704.1 ATP-binding protein [Cohaesibacter sp. CAU 1516]